MHEVTIKKQEADTHAQDVAEKRRSNRAREKIDVGQFEDKKFLETMKTIFGKGGVIGAAGTAAKAFNDFTWYNRVPGIIDAAGKLPDWTPSDVYIRDSVGGHKIGNNWSALSYFTTIPSLMCIRYIPTIGCYSGAYSSAASNAARRLYNIIRQANSAASAYDPGELMKLIIAVGSIYTELINLKRAMQAVNKDDNYSRALSRLVVEAAGFNYSDLSMNREAYRQYYNTMAHLMYSFKIPTKLTIFMRWAWMNSLLIKDSNDNVNCQRYMFRPALHYVYNDGTGKLTAVANNTVHTLNSFRTMLDTAYYGIFNSSAAVTIFRDIQKAVDLGKLDSNELIYLSPIGEEIYNEPFAEQYNPEVVNQIHNATLCGAIDTIADFDLVSSTDGTLVLSNPVPEFTPAVGIASGAAEGSVDTNLNYRGENHIISLLDNDASVARVTVATRLKVRGELSIDANSKLCFSADIFGTEICTTAEIYTFQRGATQQDFDPSNTVEIIYLAMNTKLGSDSQAGYVRIYNQFDGAPKVTFAYQLMGTGIIWDVWKHDKVIYLPDTSIERRLHEACILSELSYL